MISDIFFLHFADNNIIFYSIFITSYIFSSSSNGVHARKTTGVGKEFQGIGDSEEVEWRSVTE